MIGLSKGERTREMILARAAPLFNSKGYGRVSMSDLMQATGLEKGGIYNHFRSREELMVEAFRYAADVVRRRVEERTAGPVSSADRLREMVAVYGEFALQPPIEGGCPLLNAAVESDDADPALREQVAEAMERWFRAIRVTLVRGIRRGDVRPDVDVEGTATLIISTLEGAVMLSRLYRTGAHMQSAVRHLQSYIESTIRA